MVDKAAAEEAISDIGAGPRARQNDEQVFENRCLEFVARWLKANKNDATSLQQGACVFLFDPNRPPNDLFEDGERQLGFFESLPLNLEGHAYSCSNSLNSVFRVEIPNHLSEVPDIFSWIKEADLESSMVIIFLPRLSQLYTKRLGIKLESDQSYSFIQLPQPTSQAPFVLNDLDRVLEFFYDYAVKTQLGTCRIWFNSKERKLMPWPEDMIQQNLYQTLMTHIDFEQRGMTNIESHNVHGRSDISITVNRNNAFSRGILELKVLSPDKTEAGNLAWAKKGVEQADDYREAEKLFTVECAYACLYDGRKEDTEMPDFFTEADSKDVIGRRYFMATEGVPRKIISFTQ